MTTDLPVFFLLAFSAGLSIVISGITIWLYSRQHHQYVSLQADYDRLWERVLMHSEAMIKRAHKQALQIIEDSEFLTAQMKQQVKEALVEAEENEEAEYQKTLAQIQKKITHESMKHLEEFSASLLAETKKNEQNLEKRQQAAQQEIQTYLEQRKQQIEAELKSHIFSIIQSVLQKVTGQLLSQEQHEQLILDALQQAKEEHVL